MKNEQPNNKLWHDLKSDDERLEFIRSGRAWDTGIIAKAVQADLVDVYERLIKLKQQDKIIKLTGIPKVEAEAKQ